MPTALVVDDDPAVQHLARHVLAEEGFIVRTAATAVDAMGWLRGEEVDLLLVDIRLIGIDGFMLLTQISALGLAPHARIVVISGRSDAAALARAREVGADVYLVKPLLPADLVSLARSAVARSSR
jgi:DNA-binding response OmpR family regulator